MYYMLENNKYNDGHIHDNFYSNDKVDLEKRAIDFSEGNSSLKDVLLSLWNNGIETYACCAGHPEIKDEVYRNALARSFIKYSQFIRNWSILLE